MVRTTFAALCLCATTLHSGIVDRQLLATPQSKLVDTRPGPVVAGGGMFLVHGQRITPDGVKLDDGPLSDVRAVGWSDGWMLLREGSDGVIAIEHESAANGAIVRRLDVASKGSIVGAAGSDGRIAILELQYGPPDILWLTVVDESKMVGRRALGSFQDGTIAAIPDGFIAVADERLPDYSNRLTVWRFDRTGATLRSKTLGPFELPPTVSLTPGGDGILLVTRDSWTSETVARIVGPELEMTDGTRIVPPAGTNVTTVVALPDGNGFFLSYGARQNAGEEYFAASIDRSGTLKSLGNADPIVGGDRVGETYLVMRPWGVAAIAEGDPRTIVSSPIDFKRETSDGFLNLTTVVSGDVTLVPTFEWVDARPSRRLLLVDSNGVLLANLASPSGGSYAMTATPDGFALLSGNQEGLWLQRLARGGEWLQPVLLISSPIPTASFDLDVSENDIFLAWANHDDVFWQRFAVDGTPIDAAPSSASRFSDLDPLVGVVRNGAERLLLIQGGFSCQLSPCFVPDQYLEILAIGADGNLLGEAQHIESRASLADAIGLADGTWVVPYGVFPVSLLHLARDGSPLGEPRPTPLLNGLRSIAPDPAGWKAIAGAPERLVVFDAWDHPAGMTGLSGVDAAAFGAGGVMLFLDRQSPDSPWNALWSGRFASMGEGDLSIRLNGMTPKDQWYWHSTFTIRNETATPVTEAGMVFTRSGAAKPEWEERLSAIPGNASLKVRIPLMKWTATAVIVSDDVTDGSPEDNIVMIPYDLVITPSRQHPSGRR
ncbi:MAG: hypothetical protein WBX15_10805 [Thermoanaerobaculia bacterium]